MPYTPRVHSSEGQIRDALSKFTSDSQKDIERGRKAVCIKRSSPQEVIYRNPLCIYKLVELEFEFLNGPSMAEPLGLDSLKSPHSDERSSKFMRSNPNGYFQIIREVLV